jgi:hypothetical protein
MMSRHLHPRENESQAELLRRIARQATETTENNLVIWQELDRLHVSAVDRLAARYDLLAALIELEMPRRRARIGGPIDAA